MIFGRAFTYAFDDPEVVSKLVISAALAFFGAITSFILIGLVAYAALLGYLVELVRNLRSRQSYPLPRWDNFGDKLSQGGSVLVAMFIYNLPNFLLSCCFFVASNFISDGMMGLGVSLIGLCCVTPLLLVYNLVTWPMLALGLARFADEGNIVTFFQFGDLFNTVRRDLGATVQWIFYTFIANLVIGLLFLIPCIGWALAPALALPVQGFLMAQYADRLEGWRRQPAR